MMVDTMAKTTTEDLHPTRFLDRPGGRIGYDVAGAGPLVVCIPGMGDLRSSYRFLAPALVAAGYRVVTMDLRGHGDSDATFSAYDDVAAGTDVVALLTEVGGGPAVLVGNSMGAGAAAWAAAEAPDLVAALVLVGPFVRNPPAGRAAGLLFRLALLRPWGPAAWNAWYARLFPGRAPADLAEPRRTWPPTGRESARACAGPGTGGRSARPRTRATRPSRRASTRSARERSS